MTKRPAQYCPIADTLSIVGEKWTLLIVRDLLLDGARRFQDLQDSLEGIAASTLSTRLKTLEAKGLVAREFYSDHPPRTEYLLTDKGRAIAPVIAALRDWGRQHASVDR